jgi:hypothetical protein
MSSLCATPANNTVEARSAASVTLRRKPLAVPPTVESPWATLTAFSLTFSLDKKIVTAKCAGVNASERKYR